MTEKKPPKANKNQSITEPDPKAEPQTPVFLDQDGNPIPFFKKEKERQKEQETKKFRIGLPAFLGGIALLLLLATLTPFYSILMRITPASWQKAVLKPLYIDVTLGSQPQTYSEPLKMPIPESGTLPVLGFDTGICFFFYSTLHSPDPAYIGAGQMEGAKRGKPLAEIIAIGAKDKYEYKMEATSYSENIDKENNIISVICQKFGRAYGTTPESISALYIRPLENFKAAKTSWKSIKHLYDDYSSPLEPNTIQMP